MQKLMAEELGITVEELKQREHNEMLRCAA